MTDPVTALTHHDEDHGHYQDRPSLHDRLTAAFTGALTEMWQPTVGHSCTGGLPAIKDDARVLAKVAETVLAAAHAGVDPRTEVEAHWGGDPEQLVDVWERDRAWQAVEVDRLRAYLAYATHFDVCGIEVYPQGDAWMCRGASGIDEHDGPHEALDHARQRAGVEQ